MHATIKAITTMPLSSSTTKNIIISHNRNVDHITSPCTSALNVNLFVFPMARLLKFLLFSLSIALGLGALTPPPHLNLSNPCAKKGECDGYKIVVVNGDVCVKFNGLLKCSFDDCRNIRFTNITSADSSTRQKLLARVEACFKFIEVFNAYMKQETAHHHKILDRM